MNTTPAWDAPSGPADVPSRPTPVTTPPTATHSRQRSTAPISHVAQTAVTARFAAIIAWTANSGSRCSATSWARKPTVSSPRLATNRHWCSIRTISPGSTPGGPAAAPLCLAAAPSGPAVALSGPGAAPSRPGAAPVRPAAGRWVAARTAIACITEATP